MESAEFAVCEVIGKKSNVPGIVEDGDGMEAEGVATFGERVMLPREKAEHLAAGGDVIRIVEVGELDVDEDGAPLLDEDDDDETAGDALPSIIDQATAALLEDGSEDVLTVSCKPEVGALRSLVEDRGGDSAEVTAKSRDESYARVTDSE